MKGEFVGDAGRLAGIGLSTNGRQVIAYLCNGTGQHVSLAQWFKGPVTSNGVDITNAHGAHLALMASPPVGNVVSVTVPNLGTFRLTPCREAQC